MSRGPGKSRSDTRVGRPPLHPPDETALGSPVIRSRNLSKNKQPANGGIKQARLVQEAEGGWRMYVEPDWVGREGLHLVTKSDSYEPKIMASVDRALHAIHETFGYHGEVVVVAYPEGLEE